MSYKYLDKEKNIKVKAVVIDETNAQSARPQFDNDYAYSYLFIVNGKTYMGDTHNKKLKVGDSLWVEYAPEHPSFSRPIKENK